MKRALALVVVIVAISISFFWYSNGESEGVVLPSDSINDVKSANTTLKTVDTDFFSLQIPSELRQRSKSEYQSSAIVGQYAFWTQDPRDTRQLGITVGTLNGGTLSDVSFVKQRELTSEYQTEESSSGVLVLTKLDKTEHALFLSNGSNYAALVFSAQPLEYGSMNDMARLVRSSFVWK